MSDKHPYSYKVAFFSITAKTSLHAGAGGENFWIVDNLVQRDPATNLPCIYASSLKGALREHLRGYLVNPADSKDLTWVKLLFDMFGNDRSDVDKDIKNDELALKLSIDPKNYHKLNYPGQFRVLQADLLSLPVLKEGQIFFRASCPWLKENLEEKLSLFGYELNNTDMDDVIGTKDYITNEEFCENADDFHLPVIARNHLEDGASTNLWYEQVLPRDTKLIFQVLYEEEALFARFRDAITAHPVQIGANASVGYGFCKIELIQTKLKNGL